MKFGDTLIFHVFQDGYIIDRSKPQQTPETHDFPHESLIVLFKFFPKAKIALFSIWQPTLSICQPTQAYTPWN